MMQTSPYSIYVDKRPLKIAFLVDPEADGSLVERIITYNHGKWGGRYNPIIPCDGGTMSRRWWEFLSAYDPDVIKSFVPLSIQIAESIEQRLSPYLLDSPRGRPDLQAPIHLVDEGLSILPAPLSPEHTYGPASSRPLLVRFDIGKEADPVIRSFIQSNFGVYDRTPYLDNALSQVETRWFEVNDRVSLSSALHQLSTFEPFHYPAQACSIPNHLPDVSWDDHKLRATAIVVGDSVADLIHTWNRALVLHTYDRHFLRQLWLPLELAKDDMIQLGLKKWILRAVEGNSPDNQWVDFQSLTLGQADLEDIAKRLTESSRPMWTVQVISETPVPDYCDGFPFFRLKETMDLYRAVGEEEHVVLKEPEVHGSAFGGRCWVADVYIELKSKPFKNIIGRETWYKLPVRNVLARHMFDKPARIGRNGLPSVIMSGPSGIMGRAENELRITPLSDEAILLALVLADNKPFHGNGDLRSRVLSRPFDHATPSDKGKYLLGFLELFSGLYDAYRLLESRYWRRMLDAFSAQDAVKDDKKLQEVINKLGKRSTELLSKPDGIKWLAEYVFQLAKGIPASDKELPFEHFVHEAQRELDEFKSLNESEISFSRNDLKDEVTDLMERGIFVAGIRPHCPFCGIANWYKVDDVRQELECTGCSNGFPLEAETKWYYKLNQLVLSGYANHGLVPVVLVLGGMLLESRTSFMISPSLELYDDSGGRPIGDLDVVCVSDGEFIIGEVKQRVGLFHHSDFVKARALAERLRPDKIIFSSLDKEPNQYVATEIEKLKQELSPVGTDVEWYYLPSNIFEPSPVR